MNKFFSIIPIILIAIGILFVVFYQESPSQPEHYNLNIIAEKENFQLDEPIEFKFQVSGYGSDCGTYTTYIKNATFRSSSQISFLDDCPLSPKLGEFTHTIKSSVTQLFDQEEPGEYLFVGEFRSNNNTQYYTEFIFIIEK